MGNNRDSVRAQSVLCFLIFCSFTFLYLYFFQADMLAYAQHVLSKGVTVYNPLIGACVITVVLLLLSLLSTSALSKSLSCFPALGHLPSVLVLAAITDINIVDAGQRNVFGYTWLVALVLFAIAFVFNNYASRMVFIPTRNVALKALCVNLFLMFFMFVFAVCSANTSEEDHTQLRSENLIAKGEYGKATQLIDRCNANTTELTVLRAFALANTRQLGESFFKPNIVKGACSLLPMQSAKLQMLPEYGIYKALGGIPSKGLTVRSYLEIMDRRGCLTAMGRDYLLTAYLMDKDLDAFVEHYLKWGYPVVGAPRNYGEALVIYAHRKGNGTVGAVDAALEQDYRDFQAMQKKYPGKTLRENALRDKYGNTYWFYYFFTASSAFTQSVSSEN